LYQCIGYLNIQNENSVIIYSPSIQVVSNLYDFLSSAEHKGRYFEEYG